jgi:hypothetical protein
LSGFKSSRRRLPVSEDRDRLLENTDPEQADDDVEAHRLLKDPTTDDSVDSDDDVEAHRLL